MSSKPVYLTAADVRARYSKSDMTIFRWVKDPRMGFPQPVYFGRCRFWRLDELEAWENRQKQRA